VHDVLLKSPVIGMEHALVLGRREGETCSPIVPASLSLGEALKSARERAGLSLRALSRAAGASAMTVRGAEQGRDLRGGTLARCLDALPDLSPWSLFVRSDEASDLPSRERIWEYYRDLFGCETEEEAKHLRLSARGNASMQILTRGLRRLRPTPEPFVLRLGRSRPVLLRSHAELDSFEMDESLAAGLHVRRVTSAMGEQQHELIVPAEAAARGVTFARRFRHPGVFTMTQRRARKRTGMDGPFREGTSFGVLVPTRRLRIVVEFPRGHWPEDVRAQAWSAAETPSSERADSSSGLHPEGLRVIEEPSRGRLALELSHALPTVKYSLGWQLP
jgi:transcriptional regulator with XRE-family HTH domain